MLPKSLTLALEELSPFALAFSGGLDSRFLAHAAGLLPGVEARLLHVTGPHVSARESRLARDWAAARAMPLIRLEFDPLALPLVRANGTLRCYHCKRAMFLAMRGALEALPDGADSPLCDGSNASDLSAYRPGLKALRELGVRSPLAACGLDKAAIRRLGRQSGLDNPEQRARPCLLTRFAYDLPADRETLAALDAAETAMEALLEQAAARGELSAPPDFRLRLTAGRGPSFAAELHMDSAPPPDLAEVLLQAALERGFSRPSLHVSEKISGHYDREKALKPLSP